MRAGVLASEACLCAPCQESDNPPTALAREFLSSLDALFHVIHASLISHVFTYAVLSEHMCVQCMSASTAFKSSRCQVSS